MGEGENVTPPRWRWEMVIVDGKMGEIGKMVLFWSISQVGDRRLLREGERIFWEEVMLFFRGF